VWIGGVRYLVETGSAASSTYSLANDGVSVAHFGQIDLS
jgi:hypothetical protein